MMITNGIISLNKLNIDQKTNLQIQTAQQLPITYHVINSFLISVSKKNPM